MFSTAADEGGGSREDRVKPTVLDQAHWDVLRLRQQFLFLSAYNYKKL